MNPTEPYQDRRAILQLTQDLVFAATNFERAASGEIELLRAACESRAMPRLTFQAPRLRTRGQEQQELVDVQIELPPPTAPGSNSLSAALELAGHAGREKHQCLTQIIAIATTLQQRLQQEPGRLQQELQTLADTDQDVRRTLTRLREETAILTGLPPLPNPWEVPATPTDAMPMRAPAPQQTATPFPPPPPSAPAPVPAPARWPTVSVE